jgi:hypothetical protein
MSVGDGETEALIRYVAGLRRLIRQHALDTVTAARVRERLDEARARLLEAYAHCLGARNG